MIGWYGVVGCGFFSESDRRCEVIRTFPELAVLCMIK